MKISNSNDRFIYDSDLEMRNLYEQDKVKREEIIKNSLLIAIKNNKENINKNNVKEFFSKNYDKYISIHINNDVYSYGGYWFNDAGFQFEWRNHTNNIVLECLTWNEVYKRITSL